MTDQANTASLSVSRTKSNHVKMVFKDMRIELIKTRRGREPM